MSNNEELPSVYYCSFVGVDYIICECGDDFNSEEALKEHLQKYHIKKETEDSTQICEEVIEEEINFETDDFDPNADTIVDSEDIEYNNCLVVPKSEPQEVELEYIIEDFSKQNIIKLIKDDGDYASEIVLGEEVEVVEDGELTLATEKLLEDHLTENHNIKEEVLDCLATEELLRDHLTESCQTISILKPETVKLRICQPCHKIFTNEKAFLEHNKNVHSNRERKKPKPAAPRTTDKNRICEVCGKTFASNAALTYHQRVHTGERPYQCNVCQKGFTMPLLLQIHVRTHTGERPYQCQHCPKSFNNKAAINRHSRVHTGIKPYPCPECGKTFSQSNSMKLHVRTVHLKLPAPYKSKKRILAQQERLKNAKVDGYTPFPKLKGRATVTSD